MAIEVFNRYETKFLLNRAQFEAMQRAIADKTIPDKYCIDGKFYTICNVYYDTPDNELIRRSLSKPVYKEKLRLRSYGTPKLGTPVFLEIKKKYDHIVNKRRTTIGLESAKMLTEHLIRPEHLSYANEQVMDELYYFVQIYNPLQPKVYLAYDRQAYAGIEDSELRITFDKNIRTRRYDVGLEYGDYGRQLLNEGVWLMEIKCAGAMPLWLTDVLSKNKIYKTSFSKYGTEYKQYLAGKDTGVKIYA
ncbi:MAG: polyphosphate polymerase domain-containing protein [Firmicutes bacterium]|nr:polyphosphate polymerase domain-containing protein [Bacillota bacterium]